MTHFLRGALRETEFDSRKDGSSQREHQSLPHVAVEHHGRRKSSPHSGPTSVQTQHSEIWIVHQERGGEFNSRVSGLQVFLFTIIHDLVILHDFDIGDQSMELTNPTEKRTIA
jgi:hypothetical protein